MCVVELKNLQANMDEIDFDNLYSSFHRYGASPNFKINQETHEISGYGYGTAMAQVAGRRVITMTIDFPAVGLKHFAMDLTILRGLGEERDVRARNPTVQRAYEEYQLLLKLSK